MKFFKDKNYWFTDLYDFYILIAQKRRIYVEVTDSNKWLNELEINQFKSFLSNQ